MGMDAVYAEFDRACKENPFYPDKLGFCFPDIDVVVKALEESGSASGDYTSDAFLGNVDEVFRKLHAWPPAWFGMASLLDPGRPWTRAYCDRVITSKSWSPFAFFGPLNYKPLLPLLRFTIAELQEQSPEGVAVLNRWFDMLRSSPDAETLRLFRKFEAQDVENSESGIMRLRPFEELLQYLLSRVAASVLGACGRGAASSALLDSQDAFGRTILHVAAEMGNTPMVEVLLRSKHEAERAQYVAVLDNDGYTAADLARLGGFRATADAICEIGGVAHSEAPREPVHLFRAKTKGAHAASGAGGWSTSDAGVVPAEWLPAAEDGCAVDCITAEQFDWNVFEAHYVRHGRPLLVKAGAEMDADVARQYTRKGILETAGSRKVRSLDFPYADGLRNDKPIVRELRDYVRFLDARLEAKPAADLSYVFAKLPPQEEELSFAFELPKILQGRVTPRTTQFYIGGVLMGSPMHHHIHAANSLMYGRKLWLLKPPEAKEFHKTVIYDDLVRSGGSSGVTRLVQEPGDLLFVPSGWVHAAVCLNHCVGVAHEFDLPEQDWFTRKGGGDSTLVGVVLAAGVLVVVAFLAVFGSMLSG